MKFHVVPYFSNFMNMKNQSFWALCDRFFHYKKKNNLFLNKQKSPKHSKEAVTIFFLLRNVLFTSDLEVPIMEMGREERESGVDI